MELELTVKKTFDIRYLHVCVFPRYWEDATVNNQEDTEGDLIPCRVDEYWNPKINIDTGQIVNWDKGKTANIHYKVCDVGSYILADSDNNQIFCRSGYVPNCLQIDDNGYGDYIILTIDEEGFIDNWKADFDDLLEIDD